MNDVIFWNEKLERRQSFGQENTYIKSIYCLPDVQHSILRDYYINNDIIEELRLDDLFKYLYRQTGYVVGKASFTRLEAGKDIQKHVDNMYHLTTCMRTHIPIITAPNVDFIIDGEVFNLEANKVYAINNIVPHEVINRATHDRVHFLIDLVVPGDSYYQVERSEFDRFI
jgi:hypothetical protein